MASVTLSSVHAIADDLDALVQQALQNNREVAAAEQKWHAMEQRTGATRSLPDPMAGVDVERSGTTDFGDYDDLEFMVQQDLPGFGKRGARRAVARLDAEAEGYRFLETARNVRSRTLQAYWDLWLARREAETAARTRDLMDRMASSALARYESGSAMQGEVLRIQLERIRMSNEVVTLEREADVARAELNALLNAPPATPRAVEDDPPLPSLDVRLEDLQARARKFCCILLSYLRNVEAREAAVRAARVERRPDLQLRAEARQFEATGNIEEYDTGVFLSIPWLWRGKYTAAIREAEAEVAMAQADYESEVNRTVTEIQALHTKAETARRTLSVLEDDLLPRARALADSTAASYTAGQITLIEFLDAQKTHLDTQLEAYRARAEFAKNHAMLMNIAAPWGPYEIATGLVTEDMNDE